MRRVGLRNRCEPIEADGKHESRAEEKLRNHNIIKKTSQFLIYITMSIEGWENSSMQVSTMESIGVHNMKFIIQSSFCKSCTEWSLSYVKTSKNLYLFDNLTKAHCDWLKMSLAARTGRRATCRAVRSRGETRRLRCGIIAESPLKSSNQRGNTKEFHQSP